ncbi:MAG TPA: hypothetical protein VGS23_04140 [Thermoplasmata archaeon]|nr:hypothetical protein [Thermoplasmata archaeon]
MESAKRRRTRRWIAGIGVVLIAAVLVSVSSFHTAALDLTIKNDAHGAVRVFLSVNGATVFNQTLDAGASWSTTHALSWFAPLDPWSCERVVVVGHTGAGPAPINDTFPVCSGQPVNVTYSTGSGG